MAGFLSQYSLIDGPLCAEIDKPGVWQRTSHRIRNSQRRVKMTARTTTGEHDEWR
jgi:hypothetical protein